MGTFNPTGYRLSNISCSLVLFSRRPFAAKVVEIQEIVFRAEKSEISIKIQVRATAGRNSGAADNGKEDEHRNTKKEPNPWGRCSVLMDSFVPFMESIRTKRGSTILFYSFHSCVYLGGPHSSRRAAIYAHVAPSAGTPTARGKKMNTAQAITLDVFSYTLADLFQILKENVQHVRVYAAAPCPSGNFLAETFASKLLHEFFFYL